MNFIQELFYGNLQPNIRTFSKDSAYAKAISIVNQQEESIPKQLDNDLKSQFFAYADAQSELISITAYESFLDGFLLGAGFMRDTFLVEPDRDFQKL